MSLRICLAGATGWAGSALARGIARTTDLQLVAAVSRGAAGRSLGDALGEPTLAGVPVHATAAQALAVPCDVFVEYTKPDAARANVLAALASGANVVVGTSGLTDADYADIDQVARARGRGVLACGNFALTVALLQKFALLAARVLPQWEIIDYASDRKRDAPSGTARELAARLGEGRPPAHTVPVEDTVGPREARGATLGGTQVHSVRLPGHTLGVDVVFGLPDETLSLRHVAGTSAEPYVGGALLAIRKVVGRVGVTRGLDRVLDDL